MSLLDGIKGVVKRVGDKVKDASEARARSDKQLLKLEKWKDKFENARLNWDQDGLIDERELIKNGTHDVDKDINKEVQSGKKSNMVVNIVHEFIEAQVDTTIPQPSVKSKWPGGERLARMIEDSAKNDLQEMGIERINDEAERTTPIQGFSLMRVDWDPDFKHHLYRGEIKVSAPHPKQLIPQPGVYSLQEMDYFFLLYSMTKAQVKKRYRVDVANEGEQFPEYNYFYDEQAVSGESDKVTVIVCWYKDDDGDIGKFSWCNETILEELPKFYYRRLQRCSVCGAVKGLEDYCTAPVVMPEGMPMGEGMPMLGPDGMPLPMECGNKKFRQSIEETETLTEDTVIGQEVDSQGNMVRPGVVIPAGTEVPYYQPQKYPVILRRNVPVAFQLGGQSDVDLIRDQQDALKKIVHSLADKIIRGGHVIKALDDHKFKLKSEPYQVVRGSQNQLNALSTMDVGANIQRELETANFMYEKAQDVLGVTNAWMGKEDSTAESGVAKQIQVQQASGRMQSKLFNKYAAFKELFEIMFEFKLAYYDELRPYMRKGADNKEDWGEFSKYEFLAQDASGKWYYNDDFLFSASAGEGFPKERMWVATEAKELFKLQAVDKVGLWTILEGANYPQATVMKEAAIQEKQMMMQQQQVAQQQAAALSDISQRLRGGVPGAVEQVQPPMAAQAGGPQAGGF